MVMEDNSTDKSSTWRGPRLSVRWQDYFKPNAKDALDTFQAIKTGIDAGVVTRRKAIEMGQRIMRVTNVDDYLESLEEEDEENRVKAEADAELQAKRDLEAMMAQAGHDAATAARAGSRKDAEKASGDRGGSSALASTQNQKSGIVSGSQDREGNTRAESGKGIPNRKNRGKVRRSTASRL